METTLKCPKCGADIPLSDAFRADLLAAEHEHHEKQLAEARAAAGYAATQSAGKKFAEREAALKTEAQEEKQRNGRLINRLSIKDPDQQCFMGQRICRLNSVSTRDVTCGLGQSIAQFLYRTSVPYRDL